MYKYEFYLNNMRNLNSEYENLLAKKNIKGEETIIKHSLKTMEKACQLCHISNYDEKITSMCMIAALFHDLGKCISDFQFYISGKQDDITHPHNMISAMIFQQKVKFHTYHHK